MRKTENVLHKNPQNFLFISNLYNAGTRKKNKKTFFCKLNIFNWTELLNILYQKK